MLPVCWVHFPDFLSRASGVFPRLKRLILDILRNPSGGGLINSLYRWFILLPGSHHTFSPSCFPSSHFPFVIVYLVRIMSPKPTRELSSDNRGVLLTQIVAGLRTTRYQLTYFIDKAFDAWLNSISDMQGSLSNFLFGWFFVLPTFVLLDVLCLLAPVFAFFFHIFFVFTTIQHLRLEHHRTRRDTRASIPFAENRQWPVFSYGCRCPIWGRSRRSTVELPLPNPTGGNAVPTERLIDYWSQ